MIEDNPCLTCGACCAFYRVSFYWAEGNDADHGWVPVEKTEKISLHKRCMKGTNNPAPRCMALEGTVGVDVYCSIYTERPSPCREFEYSWQHGVPHDRCDVARAVCQLPPLFPHFRKAA